MQPSTSTGWLLAARLLAARLFAGLLVAVLVWRGVDAVAVAGFGPGYSPWGHVARAGMTSAAVVPAFLLLLRLERRTASDYGADPHGFGRDVILGGVAYVLPCALAGTVIVFAGLAEVGITRGLGRLLGEGVVLLVLVLALEAVPEELIFRGYLYQTLAGRLPGWATILGQAAMFLLWGWLIGAAPTLERWVLLGSFALCLGALRAASGSVVVCIGFHATYQWVAQWLQLPHERWAGLRLHDPHFWFAPLALALVPFILGPLVVVAARRSRGVESVSSRLAR